MSEYKQHIYKEMELCSYTLTCSKYKIDFKDKNASTLQVLYEKDGLYAYFRVPKSKKFHLKLLYSQSQYQEDSNEIIFNLVIKFVGSTLLLLLVVFFLTLYSLKPIRKALEINDEFVKDILHDFNTPITSMVLNISMLEEKEQKNPFIKRVTKGLDTIVLLQENLKLFLSSSRVQNSMVEIASLAKERLEFMENIYTSVSFNYASEVKLKKITNRDLLIRILDNLLSNAGKYNKTNGTVLLTVKSDKIIIRDTGKGIKNISKVLERYETEQERGLGIGLHVVNKLNKELGIKMTIHSKVDEGTEIVLDFSNLKKVK